MYSAAPIASSMSLSEDIGEDVQAMGLIGSFEHQYVVSLGTWMLERQLLDCIRRSNVQGGEAGGVTQQIGATYLPIENIRERSSLKAEATIKVPGLLVIDTPGHQSTYTITIFL